MVRVFTFLKLFEQFEHAKSMLEGRLRMNTLEYFREYRDVEGELRGDPYEGVHGILQPSQLSEITFDGHTIQAKDLAAPILIHPTHVGAWNIFCMYAVSNAGLSEKVSADTLAELKKGLQIHEHCFGLGTHCVILTKPQEFLSRVRSALKAMGRGYRMKLVEYYDETSFHGFFPEEEVPFRKRLRFQTQREYRVVMSNASDAAGALTLNVGDLSDIAKITTPSQFNADLRLELPDGSSA